VVGEVVGVPLGEVVRRVLGVEMGVVLGDAIF
jgi:hypothetical protein